MASTKNSCRLLLDVGGTFVKAGMADAAGELIPGAAFTCPMPSEGTREEIAGSLTAVVARGAAFARAHGMELAGIGVAMPGPFDYAQGIARMTHKFRGIYGVSLREMLQQLPETGAGMPVRFVHDVNAVLLGEMAHGNACGFPDAAVVTLGTGLGFAFCRGSEVQYSPAGSPLLPIYNRPYGGGVLEDYASKRGFLRVYADLTGTAASLTVADLGRMAGEGDAAALAAFAEVGRILAASLHGLLAGQRIGCLLFGGQISRSFAFLEPALTEGLKDLPELVRIAPVKHIGEAAFYGLCSCLDSK